MPNDAVSIDPAMSLDDIRRLLSEFPQGDDASAKAARLQDEKLEKPPGSLGRLEAYAEWLCRWQRRHPPRVERPRICVFAANHGVAARGVSANSADTTERTVRAAIAGEASVNQVSAGLDADLSVYELSLDVPTKDIVDEPAMDEAECVRAMAYGMMAVEQGRDLLCLGDLSVGGTTAAAALALYLFGGDAQDWTGPGSGISESARREKADVVARAVARHGAETVDPFDALRRLGGMEMAAICGAVMAARFASVPVVLDGFVSTAAAAVLHAVDPRSLEHCLVGQKSTEPGHGRLLHQIGTEPILDFGMHLGQGVGAAMAIPVLRAAANCHAGMALRTG